ncbi:MAG: hypothetical protein ACPGLV_02580 [Bacteroidia bacterium]
MKRNNADEEDVKADNGLVRIEVMHKHLLYRNLYIYQKKEIA